MMPESLLQSLPGGDISHTAPSKFARATPGPLRLFLILLLALAFLSIFHAALGYKGGRTAGLGLFWPTYPAFDFVDYTLQFPYLHTPRFFTLPVFPWSYPAPAILVLYPFYKIASYTSRVVGFAVFAATVFVVDILVFRRFRLAFVSSGLSVWAANALAGSVLFLGWPIYFGLQRGNIESILWPGIALGVFFYLSDRRMAAAVLLGAVGSVKLYPLLLLGLFLRPFRPREIAAALLTAGVVTVVALRVLEPDVPYAWHQVQHSVQQWTLQTAGDRASLIVDHSCFGLIKQIHGLFLQVQDALHLYLICAGAITLALFLFRVLYLPRTNQLLFLLCAMVFLPPTSYDYTLTNTLVAWAWLTVLCTRASVAGESLRRWYLPFALFAVLLAPLTFLPAQGAVRACCLLAFLVFAAAKSLPESPQVPVPKSRLTPQRGTGFAPQLDTGRTWA